MRSSGTARLTGPELVAVVEAAGLSELGGSPEYNARRLRLLDEYGFDVLHWLRARCGRPLDPPQFRFDEALDDE